MLTLLFCIMQLKLMPGVIIGENCHKYHFCRNKSFGFLTTKYIFCHDKKTLVTTKLLSPQNYVCRDKHIFVTTTHICHNKYLLQQTEFCRNKSFVVSFVMTKVGLSWQNYVCRNKLLLWRKFCLHQNNFVEPEVLSRQVYFCRDKNKTCGSFRKW